MNSISEEVPQSTAIFPPGTGNKMAVFSAVGGHKVVGWTTPVLLGTVSHI